MAQELHAKPEVEVGSGTCANAGIPQEQNRATAAREVFMIRKIIIRIPMMEASPPSENREELM